MAWPTMLATLVYRPSSFSQRECMIRRWTGLRPSSIAGIALEQITYAEYCLKLKSYKSRIGPTPVRPLVSGTGALGAGALGAAGAVAALFSSERSSVVSAGATASGTPNRSRLSNRLGGWSGFFFFSFAILFF